MGFGLSSREIFFPTGKGSSQETDGRYFRNSVRHSFHSIPPLTPEPSPSAVPTLITITTAVFFPPSSSSTKLGWVDACASFRLLRLLKHLAIFHAFDQKTRFWGPCNIESDIASKSSDATSPTTLFFVSAQPHLCSSLSHTITACAFIHDGPSSESSSIHFSSFGLGS